MPHMPKQGVQLLAMHHGGLGYLGLQRRDGGLLEINAKMPETLQNLDPRARPAPKDGSCWGMEKSLKPIEQLKLGTERTNFIGIIRRSTTMGTGLPATSKGN